MQMKIRFKIGRWIKLGRGHGNKYVIALIGIHGRRKIVGIGLAVMIEIAEYNNTVPILLAPERIRAEAVQRADWKFHTVHQR